MPLNRARGALVALVACLLLVGLSILFVDRGASIWAHEHSRGSTILDLLTHIVDPLRAAAVVSLAGIGFAAALCRWKPGERGRTLIAASLAILVSFEIKEKLKYFFGRSWPETWTENNPSWILDHAYGFHLFHGGSGWESFPSGHTTQMAALAAVIWLRLPRLRWVGVGLVTLVAVGLWGSDYHFVGDIIAGAFLGVACGAGMVALICQPTPLLPPS
jgi:membrane-associated phospholipid phosphatase